MHLFTLPAHDGEAPQKEKQADEVMTASHKGRLAHRENTLLLLAVNFIRGSLCQAPDEGRRTEILYF